MSIFKIHHITKYEYEKPVKESMNEIKIFPYQCNEQEILSHELTISGNPYIHFFKALKYIIFLMDGLNSRQVRRKDNVLYEHPILYPTSYR